MQETTSHTVVRSSLRATNCATLYHRLAELAVTINLPSSSYVIVITYSITFKKMPPAF